MRNNYFLKDLHIGRIIKEIALQQGISSRKLAQAIHRYQENADKIYKLEDMDIGDVIRISHTLEYHILEMLSEDYLSHLPFIESLPEHESYSLTMDMRTKRFTIEKNSGTYDFLRDIHIGQHIRNLAEKNGWTTKHMAKRLYCAPNTICDLYGSKSMKMKKLFQISNALEHHLIAEVYLSRMCIVPASTLFDRYTITIHEQKICIQTPEDTTFSKIFQRQDDGK